MYLFYTIGGGLGHLTRFSSFIRTLEIDEPVTIIASSPFARDERVVDGRHNILIPPFRAAKDKESLREWLQQIMDSLKPQKIFIDAFPAGILGELTDVFFPTGAECFLLARIIKWKQYQQRIPTFHGRFRKVYQLEKLSDDYLDFLANCSDSIEPITLKLPEGTISDFDIESGTWLIVHSGPDSELKAIIEKACQHYDQESVKPKVVVIYPGKRPDFVPEEFAYSNIYPAFPLFAKAQRVYSAAGFNMVDQMRDYRSRHYLMPFERIFDDQTERCRQHADEFAEILEEPKAK